MPKRLQVQTMMITSTMTRTNKKGTEWSSLAAAHHSSTRCWPGCGSVTPFDGSRG